MPDNKYSINTVIFMNTLDNLINTKLNKTGLNILYSNR